jgi:hypothetical protein
MPDHMKSMSLMQSVNKNENAAYSLFCEHHSIVKAMRHYGREIVKI